MNTSSTVWRYLIALLLLFGWLAFAGMYIEWMQSNPFILLVGLCASFILAAYAILAVTR